jgi:hypothetical protein
VDCTTPATSAIDRPLSVSKATPPPASDDTTGPSVVDQLVPPLAGLKATTCGVFWKYRDAKARPLSPNVNPFSGQFVRRASRVAVRVEAAPLRRAVRLDPHEIDVDREVARAFAAREVVEEATAMLDHHVRRAVRADRDRPGLRRDVATGDVEALEAVDVEVSADRGARQRNRPAELTRLPVERDQK